MNRGQHRRETVASSTPFSHGWMSVQWSTVVDGLGRKSEQLVLQRPDFVLVVPRIRSSGQVVLCQRYRPVPDEVIWEFPQCRIEPPFDGWRAAALSLVNGIGHIEAGKLELIHSFYEASGYSSHRCHAVIADLDADPDSLASEFASVDPTSPSGRRFIRASADAATIAALALIET